MKNSLVIKGEILFLQHPYIGFNLLQEREKKTQLTHEVKEKTLKKYKYKKTLKKKRNKRNAPTSLSLKINFEL